jgi:hypothetical protein
MPITPPIRKTWNVRNDSVLSFALETVHHCISVRQRASTFRTNQIIPTLFHHQFVLVGILYKVSKAQVEGPCSSLLGRFSRMA